MKIISVRDNPEYVSEAIEYFQKQWAIDETMMIYEDCIVHAVTSDNSLPQWYLLYDDKKIIGCAGLITNDFISRMDLYPWICAVFIEVEYRGNHYAKLLIDKAKSDAKLAGFSKVYLCTSHVGYYEKYDFSYIGNGYHPWGEDSRIYMAEI